MTTEQRSIPHVAEVLEYRGQSASDKSPDVLIEVPHGATRQKDFDDLFRELKGPFPDRLIEFFFVNTDVGAPEVGMALAKRIVENDPERYVAVIRSHIPRTFIDCNRVIDTHTRAATSKPGEVTPGVLPYVKDAEDLGLLLARYSAYRALVTEMMNETCGNGGLAIMLHSYAPRSIDVVVDERIVERLEEAYRPENIESWPLRPEVDLIHATPEGEERVDPRLLALTQAAFAEVGIEATTSSTYSLVAQTMARIYADQYPNQVLCLEVRRDLVAEPFTPFDEMHISPKKADRMAGALQTALFTWWGERNDG